MPKTVDFNRDKGVNAPHSLMQWFAVLIHVHVYTCLPKCMVGSVA